MKSHPNGPYILLEKNRQYINKKINNFQVILQQLRRARGQEVMIGVTGVLVCKQAAFAIGDYITYEMPVEVRSPPAKQSRAT